MPHHETIEVTGRVRDIFFHRFVVETDGGRTLLADLTPKGVEIFRLEPGLEITIMGEMKPSELKVERIARKGEAAITIPHKPKHDEHHHHPHHHPHHHDHADPEIATDAVKRAGYQPIGAPRRKPKHFEVLARSGHVFLECHVELDGHVRKEEIVGRHDHKWADDIRDAA